MGTRMPTPSHDPITGLSLLSDAQMERLRDLTREEFEQLRAEVREIFHRTTGYHSGQRQKLDQKDAPDSDMPLGEWKAKHLEDDLSGREGQV
jgi:hypothetical protein